jgi:predicted small metal-binding protein
MAREITCPCGHKMEAPDDKSLYTVVRSHVDKEHPELNYSKDDIEAMISSEARDTRTT